MIVRRDTWVLQEDERSGREREFTVDSEEMTRKLCCTDEGCKGEAEGENWDADEAAGPAEGFISGAREWNDVVCVEVETMY